MQGTTSNALIDRYFAMLPQCTCITGLPFLVAGIEGFALLREAIFSLLCGAKRSERPLIKARAGNFFLKPWGKAKNTGSWGVVYGSRTAEVKEVAGPGLVESQRGCRSHGRASSSAVGVCLWE